MICGKLIWQKKKIEQDQRIREKAREHDGLEYKGIYFEHKKQDMAQCFGSLIKKRLLILNF